MRKQTVPTVGGLRQRLMVGGSAIASARVLTLLLNLLALTLLARLLTPGDFGAYVLGQTIATFGAIVGALGLEHTTVRMVAARVDRQPMADVTHVVRSSRSLVVLGSLGVGAVLLLLRVPILEGLFEQPPLERLAVWLVLWTALLALGTVQAAALRGAHRLVKASLVSGFVRALAFLAIVIFLLVTARDGLQHAVMGAVLAAGISVGLGTVFIAGSFGARRTGPAGRARADRSGVGPGALLRDSWPLLGSTIVGFLLAQADLWFVGVYAAPEELAVYAAASRAVFLVALPLAVLSNTVASTVAELHAQDRREPLERLLRGVASLGTLGTLLVASAFFVAGEEILSLLFGVFYGQGAMVLAVLSVGRVFSAATGLCGLTLMMAGEQRLHFLSSAATAVLLVAGCLWAGPRFGSMGIASVSTATFILGNGLNLAIARYRLGLSTHVVLDPREIREVLRPLISGSWNRPPTEGADP